MFYRTILSCYLLVCLSPGVSGLAKSSAGVAQQQQQRRELEAKSRSRTAAEASSSQAALDLRFVSLNTEGQLAISAAGFPQEVANVGLNKAWAGYGTKLMEILLYANSVSDDTLLVYIDGNDVVWGGCSREEFVAAYQRIVDASGA